MKMLKRNLKEKSITLKIENLEDLWHLEHVVDAGDAVTSRTMRKTVIKSGDDMKYGDRKPMTLTIKTGKVEFQKDSGILRISGQITEGPEDAQRGSHHTLQVEEGSVLTIRKDWKPYQVRRIEKAGIKKPLMVICVLDREHCDVALLRESGMEIKTGIDNFDKENMEAYYDEIRKFLGKYEGFRIVLAGPGFERENLLRFLKEAKSGIAKSVILEHSSSTGTNGIHEVIKKSADKILRDYRISRETERVQELLKRIRTEGLATYGIAEVGKAVDAGALEVLLISENMVKDHERLMEKAEKMGGEIMIIGSDHELGQQFLHLGGIAGFLRFKIEY